MRRMKGEKVYNSLSYFKSITKGKTKAGFCWDIIRNYETTANIVCVIRYDSVHTVYACIGFRTLDYTTLLESVSIGFDIMTRNQVVHLFFFYFHIVQVYYMQLVQCSSIRCISEEWGKNMISKEASGNSCFISSGKLM